ncbi:MAG: electron transport complex subunit RsxC [Nitrosomonadales bacterium]|nr:electron transport complex subunit RsxC [Nitrosomonadales bacterium]
MKLPFFSRTATFQHGVHPDAHKGEVARGIRRMPFPEKLVLPLSHHIGKPSLAIVQVGQEVVRGEPIALADGALSVPIHAPADGVIEAITMMPSARGNWTESIVLRVYQASTQEIRWAEHRNDIDAMDREQLLAAIKDCGMVGLGGAAFPSHAKLLSTPFEQGIHTLVVNGCECEPFLTCDHSLMREYPQELISGIHLAMRAVGAIRAIIGVEDNKLDVLEVIRPHLPNDGYITAQAVETKYPQGAEKMLIKSLLGLDVPAGGLPKHLGVVVHNVGTLVLLSRLLYAGAGLIERVVTVAGPGIKKPGDYWIQLGTTLRSILEWAGDPACAEYEVILGGPMMGQAVTSLDVPVTKGTSGVLVFDKKMLQASSQRGWACIHCGECVNACPMGLNPAQLGMLASKREFDEMAGQYHLGDCFECGSCSYVCPSHIPLAQQFRAAKSFLRERKKA